jgi:hypothetical protein
VVLRLRPQARVIHRQSDLMALCSVYGRCQSCNGSGNLQLLSGFVTERAAAPSLGREVWQAEAEQEVTQSNGQLERVQTSVVGDANDFAGQLTVDHLVHAIH